MKHSIGLMTLLLLSLTSAANAKPDSKGQDGNEQNRGVEHQFPAGVQSAPEISPGAMLGALTLLGGGLIVLRGLRTRRTQD